MPAGDYPMGSPYRGGYPNICAPCVNVMCSIQGCQKQKANRPSTTENTTFTLPEVSPLPEPKKEAPTGWVCPRCNVVHSPTVERCDYCRADPFQE